MINCPFCGAQSRDIAKFCQSCGRPLSPPETKQPQADQPAPSDPAKIDYLLAEIERLHDQDLVDDDAYQTIKAKYAREQKALKAKAALETAKRLYRQKQWSQAAAKAQEALDAGANGADSHLVIALACEAGGRLEDAVRHYGQAVSLRPEHEPLKKLLSRAQAKLAATHRQPAAKPEVKEGRPAERTTKPRPEQDMTRGDGPRAAQDEHKEPPVGQSPSVEAAAISSAPPGGGGPGSVGAAGGAGGGRDPESYFGGFLAKAGLNWWYVSGAFILLAGVIGLVTWQWSLLGKYAVFGLLFLLTLAMYWLSFLIVRTLRLGGVILATVASLLVPLNFYVINEFVILGAKFNWDHVGILTSFVCVVVYFAVTYWLKESHFCVFTAAAGAALLHFSLRAFGVPYWEYGLFFLPLAGLYMGLAFYLDGSEEKKFALPIFLSANAIAAAALGGSALKADFFLTHGLNNAIVMLLMAFLIYFISAYLFNTNIFVYVSAALGLGFGALLFRNEQFNWYQQGLSFMLFGVFFLALGGTNRRYAKDTFARSYFILSAVVAGAVFAIFFGKSLAQGFWEGLTRTGDAELTAVLFTTLMAAAVYAAVAYFLNQRPLVYATAGLFAYSFLAALARAHIDFVYWPVFLALILTPLLVGCGLVVERFSDRRMAFGLYVVGYSAASVAGLRAVYAYFIHWYLLKHLHLAGRLIPGARPAALWTMLVLAVILALSARLFRRPAFEYPAVACGAGFYWLFITSLVFGLSRRIFFVADDNFAFYFIPVIVGLGLAGYLLARFHLDEYAAPLIQASFAGALASVMAAFFVLELSSSAAVFAYALIFLAAAYLFKEPRLSYLSAFAFSDGLGVLLYLWKFSYADIGFWLSMAGAAWLFGGYLLYRNRLASWTPPVLNSAVIMTAAAFAISLPKITALTTVTAAVAAVAYSLAVVLLNEKQAALLSIVYFPAMILALSQAPTAGRPLFITLEAGLLLVFTACFSYLATAFEDRIPAYAACLAWPGAVCVLISIWVRKTPYPTYYALGTLGAALVLFLLGYLIDLSRKKELAEAPLVVGEILTAASIIGALFAYDVVWSFRLLPIFKIAATARNIAIAAALTGALTYAASAFVWKRSHFVYASAATSAAAYAMIGSATFIPALDRALGIEQNYGLYFIILTAALYAVGIGLESAGARRFAAPLGYVCFAISAGSIAAQVHYIGAWHFNYSVVAVFFLYCALFALVAYRRRDHVLATGQLASGINQGEAFAYLSTANFTAGFFYLLSVLKMAGSQSLFAGVGVAAAYLAVSELMRHWRLDQFKRPLFNSSWLLAVALSLLATVNPAGPAVYNVPTATGAFILLVAAGFLEAGYAVVFVYGAFSLFAFFNISFYAQFFARPDFLAAARGAAAIVAALAGIAANVKLRKVGISFWKLASLTYGIYLVFLAVGLRDEYYPIAFIAYAIALLAVALLVGKDNYEIFGLPAEIIAGLVAAVSISYSISWGHRPTALIVMAAYAAVYAVWAYIRRSLFYAYLAPALFTFGYLYALYTWPKNLPETVIGLATAILSLVWFGTGLAIVQRSRFFGAPLNHISLVTSGLAVFISLTGAALTPGNGEFAVYTMAAAGALYAAQALISKNEVYGHLAFFAWLIAYYLPLLDKQIKLADAYLTPVGLYLIALGFIYRQRAYDQSFINGFFVGGLVTILGSAFIPSIGPNGAAHAVLLLVESVAVIFVGISFKSRAFLFLGTAFLIPNGLVQFWQPLVSVHWAVYATISGLAMIVSGIAFERKRQELILGGQRIVNTLRAWN